MCKRHVRKLSGYDVRLDWLRQYPFGCERFPRRRGDQFEYIFSTSFAMYPCTCITHESHMFGTRAHNRLFLVELLSNTAVDCIIDGFNPTGILFGYHFVRIGRLLREPPPISMHSAHINNEITQTHISSLAHAAANRITSSAFLFAFQCRLWR